MGNFKIAEVQREVDGALARAEKVKEPTRARPARALAANSEGGAGASGPDVECSPPATGARSGAVLFTMHQPPASADDPRWTKFRALQSTAGTEVHWVDMDGHALPTRLNAENLRTMVEEFVSPGTFPSAAGSMSYHRRKHAAASTAEDYLEAALKAVRSEWSREVTRQVLDPNVLLKVVSDPRGRPYAIFDMEDRLVTFSPREPLPTFTRAESQTTPA